MRVARENSGISRIRPGRGTRRSMTGLNIGRRGPLKLFGCLFRVSPGVEDLVLKTFLPVLGSIVHNLCFTILYRNICDNTIQKSDLSRNVKFHVQDPSL